MSALVNFKNISLVFLFITVSLVCQAYFVLDELPAQFIPNRGTLVRQTMGGVCTTSMQMFDGSPCVASLLPLVSRPRFFGSVLIGNGYDAVKTTNDVLYKPMSQSELENLFSQNNILETSGSLKLTFLAPKFVAQFTPFDASLQSVIRNASYPVVGIHAMNERSLLLGWGSEWFSNITVGAHLRLFQRRFVHNEYQMFQAVTNSGGIIKPAEQSGVAFDPSVTWWTNTSLNWRWTLGMENWGFVNKQYGALPFRPNWIAGTGLSTPLSYGLLEVGFDWRSQMTASSNQVSGLMLGANYRFGALQFMAGMSEKALSGGMRFSLRNIDLGVSYFSTQWPSGSADSYQQTLMTQIGLGF